MIAATQQQLENYLEVFSGFEKSAAGHQLPWLKKLRQDAFARFCEVGFPTTRVEDWRFTNVSAIAKTRFQLARGGRELPSRHQMAPYRIHGAACQLVFVDGRFAPELSIFGESSAELAAKVHVENLGGDISRNPELVEPYLGQYLNTQRDPFAALNTAFMEDGGYVHIRKGKAVEEPICLLCFDA